VAGAGAVLLAVAEDLVPGLGVAVALTELVRIHLA